MSGDIGVGTTYAGDTTYGDILVFDGGESGLDYTIDSSTGDVGDWLDQQYNDAVNREWYNANNYDHSTSNTYDPSDFDADNINMANPYEMMVVKYIRVNHLGYWSRGRWIETGQSFTSVYGVNAGYTDFEESIYSAQEDAFNETYTGVLTEYDSTISVWIDEVAGVYTESNYGDTDAIGNTALLIADAQRRILELETADSNTSEYNRITDTDNSELISSLNEELSALNDEFTRYTELYDGAKIADEFKKLLDLARGQQERDPFWKPWKPVWKNGISPVIFPRDYSGAMTDANRLDYTNDWINGSMNMWMAGGVLYDAPRAGDSMFHVDGDLNTTKFLSKPDYNQTTWSDWNTGQYHSYNKKVFGNMAGDEFFAVSPLAQRI